MSEAARIGIVLHDFSAGGTERIAVRLANLWSRNRDAVLLCGSEEGPAREHVAADVTVRRAGPPIHRGWRSRRRLGRAIAAMLRADPVDILVGPGNFHIPVLQAIAEALGDACPPIVCKLSNPLAARGRHRLGQAMFEARLRRATHRFDTLVAMSPALRDEAVAVLGHDPIVTLFEPVDMPAAAPVDRDPAAGAVATILSAGRFVPQKNMALALNAFARLTDRPARLVMAGDGPQRAELQQQAERLGISRRVSFPGHVSSIAPLLNQADLFLATSSYEGYPAVLMEAIAAGVPIVTTRSSPAIDEILMDRSFGRMAAGDPAALADAIRLVLDAGKPDPAARAEFLRRHDPEQAAMAWLALLDDVVRVRRAQRRQAAHDGGAGLFEPARPE